MYYHVLSCAIKSAARPAPLTLCLGVLGFNPMAVIEKSSPQQLLALKPSYRCIQDVPRAQQPRPRFGNIRNTVEGRGGDASKDRSRLVLSGPRRVEDVPARPAALARAVWGPGRAGGPGRRLTRAAAAALAELRGARGLGAGRGALQRL